MITVDKTIPLGGLTGQTLEESKSSFAETQVMGQTLVSVALPGDAAVETHGVVAIQGLFVMFVARE